MWLKRDWVIRAFANEMSCSISSSRNNSRVILLPASHYRSCKSVATGFNRNHVLTTEGGIIHEHHHVEYVADRVHTTATVFLAMSMHSHAATMTNSIP